MIRKPEGISVQELITDRSADADVVFLGLRSIDAEKADGYVDRLLQLMSGLRSVMLVRNAGPFRGQLLGVEHGESPLA